MTKVRLLRIDYARGLLMCLMILTHYSGYLSRFNINLAVFFSIPDGFIFISSLVAGLIYAEKINQINIPWGKFFQRTRIIYFHNVITFLVVTFMIMAFKYFNLIHFNLDDFGWLFLDVHFVKALLLGIALVYQPYCMDILIVFMVMSLYTPIILMMHKLKLTPYLVALSCITWLSVQLMSYFSISILPIIEYEGFKGYMLNIFSWQLLFMFGTLIGIKYGKEKAIFHISHEKLIFIVAFAITLLFFILRIYYYLGDYSILQHNFNENSKLYSVLFSKQNLGILSLLNFFSFAYCIYYVTTRYKFNLPYENFLSLVGKHSLLAFSYHVIAVYLVIMIRGLLQHTFDSSLHLRIAIDAVLLLIIIIGLKLPVAYGERKNRNL